MSGETAERLVLVSAGAARRISALLEKVEDLWGTKGSEFSSKELTARLDSAGHVHGGGFDRCAVCQEMVKDLPGAIADMVATGAEGQS